MNTFRKQSRKPKPLSMEQLITQFRRGAEANGYTVDVNHGSGRYSPALELSAWPKRERKEVAR